MMPSQIALQLHRRINVKLEAPGYIDVAAGGGAEVGE